MKGGTCSCNSKCKSSRSGGSLHGSGQYWLGSSQSGNIMSRCSGRCRCRSTCSNSHSIGSSTARSLSNCNICRGSSSVIIINGQKEAEVVQSVLTSLAPKIVQCDHQ